MPERANQFVLGANYKIANGITAEASGFYTDRKDLISQDPVLAATDPENAFRNGGVGRSFGGELMVRVRRDRFFGWIAYTLSRSDVVDAPGEERRLFDFDQTHNFVAVGSYKLGEWDLGARWQYNTGSPYTPVVGSIFMSDFNVYLPQYGPLNSARFDAEHQLDLRAGREWKLKHGALAVYLDISNVYAHAPAERLAYNFDYTEKEVITQPPLIPAVGVRGSF